VLGNTALLKLKKSQLLGLPKRSMVNGFQTYGRILKKEHHKNYIPNNHKSAKGFNATTDEDNAESRNTIQQKFIYRSNCPR
jgi:hypothetical protein